MNQFFKTIIATSFLTCLTPVPLFADNPNSIESQVSEMRDAGTLRPHIGFNTGVAIPEGSYDATAQFSLETGVQIEVPFTLGAEINYQKFENDGQSDGFREQIGVLARGGYHFAGDGFFGQTYIGLGVGPAVESGDFYVMSQAIAGFDYPIFNELKDSWSLGAQARYTLISSGGPDSFGVNGALKYWY